MKKQLQQAHCRGRNGRQRQHAAAAGRKGGHGKKATQKAKRHHEVAVLGLVDGTQREQALESAVAFAVSH